MSKTAALTFRAEPLFVEETSFLATFAQLKKSEYIELAVREKNERMLKERMIFLSKVLSEKVNEDVQDLEMAIGDGLE